MSAIIPPRTFAQKAIQNANSLFLKGPVKLTDQFGLVEQLESKVGGLPELMFVGNTNVGKSSLLSAIMAPKGAPKATFGKPRDYPNASKRQGFTRTLSFFTIGQKLRLVDTPGYGFRSQSKQGSVMMHYLENSAANLQRAYVLVHAAKGFGQADADVCEILHRYGIPFNFVLTKSDLVKTSAQITSVYESTNQFLQDLGGIPDDMYITSTSRNKPMGISELRTGIYLASGLAEVAERKKAGI